MTQIEIAEIADRLREITTELATLASQLTAPVQDDPSMTVAQAAEFLNVSTSFIYDHERELGAIHAGRAVRFRRSRLEKWLSRAS